MDGRAARTCRYEYLWLPALDEGWRFQLADIHRQHGEDGVSRALQWERKLALMDRAQGRLGVLVDVPHVSAGLGVVQRYSRIIGEQHEIGCIVRGFNGDVLVVAHQ